MADKRSKFDAVLDWRKMIFILPLAALWAVPLARAVNFLVYANGVYSQEQTLNASNDVHYGIALLIAYLCCLAMELMLCILLARKSTMLLLLLLSVPIWVIIDIIRYKPEQVIVLFPSMNPVWPFGLNVAPLLIGCGIIGVKKLKTNSLGYARTN
jgi:hypothetical protein